MHTYIYIYCVLNRRTINRETDKLGFKTQTELTQIIQEKNTKNKMKNENIYT